MPHIFFEKMVNQIKFQLNCKKVIVLKMPGLSVKDFTNVNLDLLVQIITLQINIANMVNIIVEHIDGAGDVDKFNSRYG